ncbi:MAG: PilW family protein [Burkholderiaceae bacterium]
MNHLIPKARRDGALRQRKPGGFTLIELMIAITLSLLLVLVLTTLFLNISRANTEMGKTNGQIESGRFAMQILQSDIEHAGYWGSYVPQFDDLTLPAGILPGDAPTAVPNPCLAFNATNWTAAYKTNLIGIPIQAYDDVPTGCGTVIANRKAGTDILVVRHAETCKVGDPNCEADTTGKIYFQSSLCSPTAQAGTTTTITLNASSSGADNAYQNMTIRTLYGSGSNPQQARTIQSYAGSTKIATVTPAWTTSPDNTTVYSLDATDYVLDTAGFTERAKDCATATEKRKFVSDIYYVRDYAVTVGDGIPTLVRSQYDLAAGTVQPQPVVPVVSGIEGFNVELGIDSKSRCGTAVDYTTALATAPNDLRDPATCTVNASNTSKNTVPPNRGDGIPDGDFVRCTTAAPCTAAQLANATQVKVFLLARSEEASPGYTGNAGKTYALGSTTLGPFTDQIKRHVFSSTVRVVNVSARRETPQ